ncbi:MAG: hypothetical protein A2Z14_08000 [Chloroflexi bacterium RBG_16_48_8]|nr:MAG: hypothetical protein A2Z14_08000 [Chloroflexi bacterium RBG_16_48_8]
MGGLSVLGFLINNTTEAVTQVKIRITLHISSEVTPIWKGIDLPYKHVRPSEKVPFLIHFPDTLLPESVVLEVINFQISGYEDAQLEVQFTGRTFTPEGEHLLLGWITNPDNHPTQIHHFHLLVGYSADEPAAMVAASIYPSSILPHQRAPFLIKLDEDQEQETGSFYPFLDATALSDLVEPSFSFPQYPEAILDPQGNLLIRGIIQNPDKISRWASASVVLLYQDQILSLALLNPPSPLGPGESRAFGLTDFPGWKTRLDELNGQLEDFYVEVFYDPLGCLEFKGQILPLAIEVTGFESTGSTLFIKGITTNPSSHLLSLPAIRAEIRTTNGKLQTSNWTILDETLAQGQSKDFLLAIRLPKGLKLSEMEIDLTGTAILEKSDLPF